MRLTLNEYTDIKLELNSIERDIVVSLADRQLSGLSSLDFDERLEEVKRNLRLARPIIRRKSTKKPSDEHAPLTWDVSQDCWVR